MTYTDHAQRVDVEKSKRLNEGLVSTRLELQAAYLALMRAYELSIEEAGPGPTPAEIERVAEAGRQSKEAMAVYSAFLNGISKEACGRANALHAVVRKGLRF